jgi:hypothetical protein
MLGLGIEGELVVRARHLVVRLELAQWLEVKMT